MILAEDKKQDPSPPAGGLSSYRANSDSEYASRVSRDGNETAPLLSGISPPPYYQPGQADGYTLTSPSSGSRPSSPPHAHPHATSTNTLGLPLSSGKPPTPPTSLTGGQSTGRRFWTALSIALGLVFLCNLVWAVPDLLREIERGRSGAGGGGGTGNGTGHWPVVGLPEGEVLRPVNGDDIGYLDWNDSWTYLQSNELNVRSCLPFTLSHTKERPFGDNSTLTSASSDFDNVGHDDTNRDTNPSPLSISTDKDYYSFAATYLLPAPSSQTPLEEVKTFLHTRGHDTSGSIHVVSEVEQDGERLKEGEVRVDVKGWSWVASAWDDLHVCRAGQGGSQGVVVIRGDPPRLHLGEWDSINLDITVRFSSAASLSKPHRGGLEIDVHNSGVAVGTVKGGFGAVDVKTTNGGVRVESLIARTVSLTSSNGGISCPDCCPSQRSHRADTYELHTSDARITGAFCANGHIAGSTSSGKVEGVYDAPTVSIQTSNAEVRGTFPGIVPGYNRPGTGQGDTGLTVKTSNGKIDVSYAIVDPVKEYASTRLVPITFTTSNDAVHITALQVPKRVATDTRIKTSNGRVEYVGFSTFQGEISVSTSSHESIDLQIAPSAGDKIKRNLRTVVKSGGSLVGTVVREGETEGGRDTVWSKLDVRTSNAGVHSTV